MLNDLYITRSSKRVLKNILKKFLDIFEGGPIFFDLKEGYKPYQ